VGWRLAWPGLAKLAAEIGYTGAVISKDQPLPGEALDGVTVPATAMALPVEVRQDETAFENTLPRLRGACEFAAQAGCKVALLGIRPSSEQPRATQAAIYRERLKQCCAVLDEYDIRLALECITPLHMRRAHPHEFIWHNPELLDFGLSVSENVGLVVDAWHWHHAGSDPEAIRQIPADRILDVHIADSAPDPPELIRDTERLLPGEGVIDFRLFFQLLKEKRYSGAVAVEVFGRGLGEMTPSDAAHLALRASEEMVTSLG
jgi:sugar phosphate isomerase/epimerase